MTKPDDIPQDVWHEADELWCRHTGANALVTAIARAIMAEREACARYAEDFALRVMPKDYRAYVFDLAAAIRNRGAA